MKTCTSLLLAALLGTASLAAAEPDFLGEPMVDLEGEATSLAAFAGEVLVVNFWASWCAPCREELPVLAGWNGAWAGRGGRVVAVSIDRKAANAARFVDEVDLALPVLVDGPDGLAAALDLSAVPSTYLLDRDGRVVMVVRGFVAADLERLRQTAEALLDRPVTKENA